MAIRVRKSVDPIEYARQSIIDRDGKRRRHEEKRVLPRYETPLQMRVDEAIRLVILDEIDPEDALLLVVHPSAKLRRDPYAMGR